VSVSSVGSTNPFAYLQKPLSASDPSEAGDTSAPSDPLQALYQTFSDGSSSDPLLAAIGSDDAASGTNPPPFSADMMQALFSVQGDQASSGMSGLQSLFGQFDADGNGQISQSEFEKAIGPDADQAKVDALFSKIDGNGDGSIDQDEMQSAILKAHGGHHHNHGGVHGAGGKGGGDPLQALLSGASADGTTSQTAGNSDGSTTTTITYADGTKVEMTTPAASGEAGAAQPADPNAPTLANLLKQLIALQAQFAAPTTSLTV